MKIIKVYNLEELKKFFNTIDTSEYAYLGYIFHELGWSFVILNIVFKDALDYIKQNNIKLIHKLKKIFCC